LSCGYPSLHSGRKTKVELQADGQILEIGFPFAISIFDAKDGMKCLVIPGGISSAVKNFQSGGLSRQGTLSASVFIRGSV
jgi:hypothetical protein